MLFLPEKTVGEKTYFLTRKNTAGKITGVFCGVTEKI